MAWKLPVTGLGLMVLGVIAGIRHGLVAVELRMQRKTQLVLPKLKFIQAKFQIHNIFKSPAGACGGLDMTNIWDIKLCSSAIKADRIGIPFSIANTANTTNRNSLATSRLFRLDAIFDNGSSIAV
ncbi:hypothetical protein K449DRAFT_432157 [Hypoxylon sp. EC38]|nr:hypothetical protein K449DRAFT_432157 [Hypoxylon sp. EC38]